MLSGDIYKQENLENKDWLCRKFIVHFTHIKQFNDNTVFITVMQHPRPYSNYLTTLLARKSQWLHSLGLCCSSLVIQGLELPKSPNMHFIF